jgi:RNA polymerase sigma-70 factor (ECF subfamily)
MRPSGLRDHGDDPMSRESMAMEPSVARMLPAPEDSIATRATLLRRLRDKEDHESWQEFFDTYWALIYRVARRAGLTDADAQDVVQETVISVARKVGGFVYDPKIGSFKVWMLRVTRWRILDRLKRIQREAGRAIVSQTSDSLPLTPTIENVPDPRSEDLASLWDREWDLNLLEQALERTKRRVSPDAYQIYDYCIHEEMAPRKVARLLGVNIARVYLTKHRVARTLKDEMEKLRAQIRLQDRLR